MMVEFFSTVGKDTSPLTRFLLVILMIVKEASYLSLQRRGLLQIPDCTGAVEELALELRGNGIPAQKHGCAQTLQNLLFFLGEGSTVLAILSPLNRLIEMNCHPFLVFGKRRVGLLEIEEFPRFLLRTRCVGEECPEFGCFGSVLLCSEHLTRPFCGKGEHNWFSSLPAPWLALIGRCWTHSLGASVQLRLSKIAHFSWPMRSKTIFGERSLRRALSEYVEHFHAERNHQGRARS